MGFWGVRVNGRPLFQTGTRLVPSLAFIGATGYGAHYNSTWGMTFDANSSAVMAINAVGTALGTTGFYGWGNNDIIDNASAFDTILAKESAGIVGIRTANLSTAHGDLQLNLVDFRVAASTFGQSATITNGPAASNPTAWVEIKVNGSTKRIPAW